MKEKRKKIIILSIAIVAVIAIIAGSTYAYWQITKTQKGVNDMVAACLDITMQNESGTFGLDKAWPISDSEGEALTGYTFEVKNNCDENVNYIVGLNSVAGSSDNYLAYSSLRLKLDDKQSSLISELGDIGYSDPENTETVRDSKLLSMESLEGGATATHNVKVWIDKDAPVTEQGKIFSGQIFITGGQGVPIYDDCFAINTDGAIMGYDYSCGYNVEVPATIAGIEVKTINQASFAMSNLQMYGLYSETTEEEKYVYYYTDENTADEFIDFAKQEFCEDPETCTLADIDAMGMTIVTTEEEFNAIDWDGYEASGYTIEGPMVAYFDSETGEAGDATSQVTSLDLSEAVYLQSVGESAFEGSQSNPGALEKVIFPKEGNVSIGDSAFEYNKLTEITISSSVEILGERAFYNNILKTVQLESGIKNIGERAFSSYDFGGSYHNEIMGELIIPASVENIDAYAFHNNEISSLVFEDTEENPSQLTIIGEAVFSSNQITELIIPSSVEFIDTRAFAYNEIASLIFTDTETNPSQLKEIGDYSFWRNNIESIIIPESVISLSGFSGNLIKSIIIPASVKTLGYSAFGDNQISSLIFEDTEENPSQLTTIGDLAFWVNDISGELIIPGLVQNIGAQAFDNNINLTEVIIKNTEGNVTINSSAFPSTATITYDPNYTEQTS